MDSFSLVTQIPQMERYNSHEFISTTLNFWTGNGMLSQCVRHIVRRPPRSLPSMWQHQLVLKSRIVSRPFRFAFAPHSICDNNVHPFEVHLTGCFFNNGQTVCNEFIDS